MSEKPPKTDKTQESINNRIKSRLFEENLKRSTLVLNEHCPITSVLLERGKSSSDAAKNPGQTSFGPADEKNSQIFKNSETFNTSNTELNSLKSELENLLKNAMYKYKILENSLDEKSSNNSDFSSKKGNLYENCIKSKIFKNLSKTALNDLLNEEDFESKLIEKIEDDSDLYMFNCDEKFKSANECKGLNPSKRTNIFEKLSSLESCTIINQDDKNRTEHVERFWSAVHEFVGDIPKETLDFLRNLSEYNSLTDELLIKEPPEKLTKVPKTDSLLSDGTKVKDSNSKVLTWEEHLEMAENLPIGSTPTLKDATLKRTENDTSANSSHFGSLTSRTIASLIENNIIPGVSQNVEHLINNAIVAKQKRESLKKQNYLRRISSDNPSDVDTNSNQGKIQKLNKNIIKAQKLSANLESRVASELFSDGLLSEKECLKILNPQNSGLIGATENPTDSTNKEESYVDLELKALKSQLNIVQVENATIAKDLYNGALQHNKRNNALKRLENVDYFLLEMYRKMQSSRSKRKTLSFKEKEQINDMLDKRVDITGDLNL